MTATNTPPEAPGLLEALDRKLQDAIGCFEAAGIEGLTERMAEADQEPGQLADLIQRRLLHAISPLQEARAAIAAAKSQPQSAQVAVPDAYPNESAMCEAAYARARLTDKAAADALRPAFRAILEAALAASPQPREVAAVEPGSEAYIAESERLAKDLGLYDGMVKAALPESPARQGEEAVAGYIGKHPDTGLPHAYLCDDGRPDEPSDRPFYTHAEAPSMPLSVIREVVDELLPVYPGAHEWIRDSFAARVPQDQWPLLTGEPK